KRWNEGAIHSDLEFRRHNGTGCLSPMGSERSSSHGQKRDEEGRDPGRLAESVGDDGSQQGAASGLGAVPAQAHRHRHAVPGRRQATGRPPGQQAGELEEAPAAPHRGAVRGQPGPHGGEGPLRLPGGKAHRVRREAVPRPQGQGDGAHAHRSAGSRRRRSTRQVGTIGCPAGGRARRAPLFFLPSPKPEPSAKATLPRTRGESPRLRYIGPLYRGIAILPRYIVTSYRYIEPVHWYIMMLYRDIVARHWCAAVLHQYILTLHQYVVPLHRYLLPLPRYIVTLYRGIRSLPRYLGTLHQYLLTSYRDSGTLHQYIVTLHRDVGTSCRDTGALHRYVGTLHLYVVTLYWRT